MEFTFFDSFLDFVSELGEFVALIADTFKRLPSFFLDYWSVLLLAIIVIGLFAIVVRLVF